MVLWVVGKANRLNRKEWEFQGVFDQKSMAENACKDDRHFVGPVNLNEMIPDEPRIWPGAYYPKTGERGK